MALDDFDDHDSTPAAATPAAAQASAPARKPGVPEDEDLFDFPVLEMKFESEAEKKPAPLPVQVAPPAAVATAAAPAPVSTAAPTATPAKPAASAASPKAAPAAAASAPAKPAAAAESVKNPGKDVAKAAQLVQDIEDVLGADGKPQKRRRQLAGPSPALLVGLGVLLLSNIGGLLFIWNSTQSFQSNVSAMNDKLTHALQVQALTVGQPETASEHAPHGTQPSGAPLEGFEFSALRMAREEIQAGEFSAARKRLARLLAVADRIPEAEQREEIEAQAAFLVASSYRKQADSGRRERP